MLWSIVTTISSTFHSWMASLSTSKSRLSRWWEVYIILNIWRSVNYAIQLEGYQDHLSACYEHHLSLSSIQNHGMLCQQNRHKKSLRKRSSQWFEDNARYHAVLLIEDEQINSFLEVFSSKFLGLMVTSKWIHLNLDNVCAIYEMQTMKNLEELNGLLRKLAYQPIQKVPVLLETD